jgi:hypothetical protein
MTTKKIKLLGFSDLIFKKHPAGMGGYQAVIVFKDGSKLSIIHGEHFYSSRGKRTENSLYEIMDRRGSVKGWRTPKQITAHMKYIQNNPKK